MKTGKECLDKWTALNQKKWSYHSLYMIIFHKEILYLCEFEYLNCAVYLLDTTATWLGHANS